MRRGMLTNEIQLKAKQLIGREISKEELRLIPYLQYTMLNNQCIDASRIGGEERKILSKWNNEGFIVKGKLELNNLGGKMRITQISKTFWDFMSEILFLSYVERKGVQNEK